MAATPDPSAIEHPCVLAVEGTHESHFFEALLEQHDMQALPPVDVQSIGGKTRLAERLHALASEPSWVGFYDEGRSLSLGIVRDADADPRGAFQSVGGALGANGFPVPDAPGTPMRGDLTCPDGLVIQEVTVAVFVLPGPDRPGALEDLCVESVCGVEAFACVEGMFECLEDHALALPEPHRMGKARAHAYLAVQPEPDGHVGIAARRGYWPFGSPVFDPLKDFLRVWAMR